MKILIIDEDGVDRQHTLEVLERYLPGARFVQPQCPAEVDAVLLWGGFDLVLTEYRLSWTDGLALLRMIKSFQPRVPVVFVTSVDSAEIAVEAMKAGLSDYVLKREITSRLPAVVQDCLGSGTGALRAKQVGQELSRPAMVTLSDEAQAEADRLWEQMRNEVKEFTAALSDVSGPKVELQALVRELYVEPGVVGRRARRIAGPQR